MSSFKSQICFLFLVGMLSGQSAWTGEDPHSSQPSPTVTPNNATLFADCVKELGITSTTDTSDPSVQKLLFECINIRANSKQ